MRGSSQAQNGRERPMMFSHMRLCDSCTPSETGSSSVVRKSVRIDRRLVEPVAELVQRRVERDREVALVVLGGQADVVGREAGGERVQRRVEPPAVGVVADALEDVEHGDALRLGVERRRGTRRRCAAGRGRRRRPRAAPARRAARRTAGAARRSSGRARSRRAARRTDARGPRSTRRSGGAARRGGRARRGSGAKSLAARASSQACWPSALARSSSAARSAGTRTAFS